MKKLLLISVILGLIVSNILTLLNNEIHETAFNSLKTVLASVVEKETLVHILSNSPTQKYAALEARPLELEQKYAALEASYNEFKQKYAALEASYNEFKQKRTNTARRISKLIAIRIEKHALRSFRSFIPRITPAIGSALTAGITILEIQDDCQIMKTMNELNLDFEIEKNDETTVCGMDINTITSYLPENIKDINIEEMVNTIMTNPFPEHLLDPIFNNQ